MEIKNKHLTRASKEMVLNFKLQYPEKYERYNLFFQKDICFKSQRAIQNGILTYCDLLEDMQFLIDLIKSEGLNTQVKSA